MKPRKLFLASIFAALGLTLMVSPLMADGSWSLTCDGNTQMGNFVGQSFPAIVCAVGSLRASFTPEIANAGNNFFMQGIAVAYDTSAEAQGVAHNVQFLLVTNPTWSPLPAEPPPAVSTFLALNGRVQIPDPTGTLDLELLGVLGGPRLDIHPAMLNHTNCAQCVLGLFQAGKQFKDPTADENLIIHSVGRTVYRTNTDTFDGALPEPSSYVLWGTVLFFALLLCRRPGWRNSSV
jgi:hypothetical protein